MPTPSDLKIKKGDHKASRSNRVLSNQLTNEKTLLRTLDCFAHARKDEITAAVSDPGEGADWDKTAASFVVGELILASLIICLYIYMLYLSASSHAEANQLVSNRV